ncbi:MAG: DnaJ domain-containing protein [Gammaproteobacteria bacterium]|nr:DnaJ domain-containing protein [Gammaproteobacteria bacterium]
MPYIVLIITIGIFSWLAFQKLQSTAPKERNKLLRQWIFIGLALIAILLAMTGRLHWVGAAIALVLAVAGQLLKIFARYLPLAMPYLLKRMGVQQGKTQNAAQQQPESSVLTPEEAQRILNVSQTASRNEIIGAHRKLIQKLHPDQGGNDYLASRINAAKELLIKKLENS